MAANMLAKCQNLSPNQAFKTRPASRKGKCVRTVCRAEQADSSVSASRREILGLAGVSLAATQLAVTPTANAVQTQILPVDKLALFQKQDQRQEFIKRVKGVIGKYLSPADAPACVRLALHDAGTYDVETKTGGFDGSIVLSEELNRPENASLKSLVAKLTEAKKEIDAGAKPGQQAISWADLINLAGKTTTQLAWIKVKTDRTSNPENAKLISTSFAADWATTLGRIDSTTPAPAGRLPKSDASVEEITAFLGQLGANADQKKGGFFAPKPPFWERPGFVLWTASAENPEAEEARFAAASPTYVDLKTKYDISRATVTRTDYEVDFITYYEKLTSLGSTFNRDAYLYPVEVEIKRL